MSFKAQSCIYIYIYSIYNTCLSLSISLSLYIYIYVCMYIYMYMCIYIYIYIYTCYLRLRPLRPSSGRRPMWASRRGCRCSRRPAHISEAPKGNGIGATGSKTPPRILEPLFFSARHGSKNIGLVLRPLCPYTVALRGVA